MRNAGILLPIFSLPSPYGIGTLGEAAYHWIDFLKEARQRYWQVLPLGPTGYGDSPYQCFSAFAGNPYLIDLEQLCQQGLLTQAECACIQWGTDAKSVDYEALFLERLPLLKKAFFRFRNKEKLEHFQGQNREWLEDYALYMALRETQKHRPWSQWPEPLRLREPRALRQAKKELRQEIDFISFMQLQFFQQWASLKEYAHRQGVSIIGDMPIYVAMDSADTWVHRELFLLDPSGIPIQVAGCPPDAFSADGQLWGNPLYRWELHRETGYRWWMRRLKAGLSLYDLLRIDHFRGLESYYAIPYGEKNAVNGRWYKGPGMNFLKLVNNTFGSDRFIAEDLGFLTPEVEALLRESRYPGMKVLQFAFDAREKSGSVYLPHNYPVNCVVYTGTHDNDTTKGWFQTIAKADRDLAQKYLHIMDERDAAWSLIRGALSSVARLAVIPMQDYLELDSSARLNIPSTTGGQNWRWRMLGTACTPALAQRIGSFTTLYGRSSSQ